MSNLNVKFEIAQSIIMKVSETYSFESDRICNLLSQIQMVRNEPSPKIKILDLNTVNVLKLIIKFLSKKDLLEVVCLNKLTNKEILPLATYFSLRVSGDIKAIRQAH